MELSEVDALFALRRLLAGDLPHGDWSAPGAPAVDRLRRALSEPGSGASTADIVVLLRQALLFESSRRGDWTAPARVLVAHPRLRTVVDWPSFGLAARASPEGWSIEAEPWKPTWLSTEGAAGVDVRSASELAVRPQERGVTPDPLLRRLGVQNYRSHAQRSAVRAALRTPEGGTLLVTLATGEGKSLIPQVVAALGFPSTDERHAAGGVTLVVVPTVTLATDQETAARLRGLSDARAYRAGDSEQNRLLRQRIREGTQKICFASPEAACGPLRGDLNECARGGMLRAIVIDEAHLVHAWGTGFRTEFQLLGGLRRELLEQAPAGQRARTFLLSATVTESARTTLRALFSGPGEFAELNAVRLRPEPEYWSAAPVRESERTRRVLQALHHLPRPLILYVTKVADAERWGGLLRSSGFGRFRIVHGRSSLQSRDGVLEDWRGGGVDVVVATSAFGVGVDYPHVRSIVHACLPESLDRYYQEVGRGGRDGRASLSLVVPSTEDRATAQRISDTTVISIRRGRQRWKAMFDQSTRDASTDTFSVRLDVSPGHDEADIDMVGERSMDWNARTLVLLERAGMVQLQGVQSGDGTGAPVQLLKILEQEHLSESVWQARVEPLRRRIAISDLRGLAMMEQFLRQRGCANDHFVHLYGADRVIKACGACSECRRAPEARAALSSPGGRYPWTRPPRVSDTVRELLGHDGRLVVFYAGNDLGRRWQRRVAEVLAALGRQGILNVTLLGDLRGLAEALDPELSRAPWFVAHGTTLTPGHLPPGPELVIAGGGHSLSLTNLRPRPVGQERILILPDDSPAPERPELPLSTQHSGRSMPFDEFHRRLVQ